MPHLAAIVLVTCHTDLLHQAYCSLCKCTIVVIAASKIQFWQCIQKCSIRQLKYTHDAAITDRALLWHWQDKNYKVYVQTINKQETWRTCNASTFPRRSSWSSPALTFSNFLSDSSSWRFDSRSSHSFSSRNCFIISSHLPNSSFSTIKHQFKIVEVLSRLEKIKTLIWYAYIHKYSTIH